MRRTKASRALHYLARRNSTQRPPRPFDAASTSEGLPRVDINVHRIVRHGATAVACCRGAATMPPDVRTPYTEGEASDLTIMGCGLRGVATGSDVMNIRTWR
jgi:hypothetical protein